MATCPLYTKIVAGSFTGGGTHSKGSYTIETLVTGLCVVWMDCFQSTSCQWWDSTNSECALPNLNLFGFHIHDSHWHGAAHGVGDVPGTQGGTTPPPSTPSKPSLLAQEYMTNEDTDGNSEVLGKDFGLDVTDSDVPKMLLTILNSPDFPVGLTTYTWAEYLATLP